MEELDLGGGLERMGRDIQRVIRSRHQLRGESLETLESGKDPISSHRGTGSSGLGVGAIDRRRHGNGERRAKIKPQSLQFRAELRPERLIDAERPSASRTVGAEQ